MRITTSVLVLLGCLTSLHAYREKIDHHKRFDNSDEGDSTHHHKSHHHKRFENMIGADYDGSTGTCEYQCDSCRPEDTVGMCKTTPNTAPGTTSPRPPCGQPAIQPNIPMDGNNHIISSHHLLRKWMRMTHRAVRHKNIVGGTIATPNSFPWLVAIEIPAGGGKWMTACGGALINNKYVITAAHCFGCGYNGKYRVVAGEQDESTEDPNSQGSCVSKVTIHPKYNDVSLAAGENDLAIVELAQPFKYNDKVSPICMPQPDDDWQWVEDNSDSGNPSNGNPDEAFVIAGWGDTSSGANKGSALLQQALVKVMDQDACRDELGNGRIGDNMMCAVGKGTDTCQGDSGGPLVGKRRDQWVLAGVVSWGRGCGDQFMGSNVPAVYQHIPSNLDWIKSVVKCPECFPSRHHHHHHRHHD